jgi:hypothetical protein
MAHATIRPLEDDAWRVGDASPGVAHWYGRAGEYDGRSKCWANAPVAGTRPAVDEDQLCPDCDSWYWQHASIAPAADARDGEVPGWATAAIEPRRA